MELIVIIIFMIGFSYFLSEVCGFKYGATRHPITCDKCGSLNHGSGKDTTVLEVMGLPLVYCNKCYAIEKRKVLAKL